jgi:phospholipid-translocating ATPase
VNFLFFLFILAILIVFTIVNGSYFTIRFTVVQVLFSISLSFRWKTAIFQIFSCFILSFLVSLYVLLKKSQNVTLIEFLNVTALNTGISFLCIFITYSIDLTKRSEYSSVQKTKKQFKKSDQILALLLPQFVKKRVNDGVRYIADDKGVVSVIFCDICEFDQIIQDYSQTELVSLLDDLFSRFDKICQDVGVSKIETVGKTYLACSGLKDFDSDLSSSINEVSHARRAIEMAFAVLHESKKTILKSGNHLKMKIGIHSGPVVAGVVGYHKPQFSLVGDTVNTASRMASTLETYDNIQISQNTLKLLQNDTEGLHFEPRNPEVKGKGNMKTFLVRATHKSSGNLQVIAELSQTINNTSPNIIKQTYIPYQNIQDDTSYHDFIKSSSWRQKISRIFCIESTAEKDFQSNNHKNDLKLRKFGLITSMMITAHLIISSSIEYKIYFDDQALYQMTYFIIDECFSLLFFIIIHKIHNIRIINYILNMFYWAEMVLFIGFQFAFPRYNQTGLLLFYFRFLLFNFCSGLLFIQCVILNFFLISVLIIQLFFFSPSIENYLYSLFFVVCTLYSNFVRERNLRKDFIIRFFLELENKKTDKLLTYMLPYKILNNLKDEKTLFDQLESVTFIYADIVGFTQWSSQRTPDQVIGMLSEMFTKFDKMCVEFGLYKVYTIGDCYVAMSYSNDHQSRFPEQEAVQVARFAFSLLDLIQEVNLKIGASLNMRIGIHTGNAVGVINGTNVVRYDVYGKDVMIANKMESHGVPGKITVSERTKELVEGIYMQEFSFEEFKNVKAWDRTIKMFNMNRK